MSNKIFVIGNSNSAYPATYGHLFGGVMQDGWQGSTIQTGIDYGGRYGFSTSGQMDSIKAKNLIFIPISETSAIQYATYVHHLKKLCQNRQSPFIFNKYMGSANIKFEPYDQPNGEKPLRAFANCITLLNYFAHASGIDLNPLHPNWFSMCGENSLSDCFKRVSSEGTQIEMKPHDDPPLEIRELNLGSNHQAFMVSCITSTTCAFNMAHALIQKLNGNTGFMDYYDSQEPFQCDPKPLDLFLEQEFAKTELKPA